MMAKHTSSTDVTTTGKYNFGEAERELKVESRLTW
jgi:hypothetical protein